METLESVKRRLRGSKGADIPVSKETMKHLIAIAESAQNVRGPVPDSVYKVFVEAKMAGLFGDMTPK